MTRKNREAAAILRGLKDRVDRLEQAVSSEGIPNLLRSVVDAVTADDVVDVTVTTGGTWEWDSTAAADEYDGTDTWG